MRLLTSQKNTLYDAIITVGLSPLSFEFNEINSKDMYFINEEVIDTTITFKNTDYYFTFKSNIREFYVLYSPGSEQLNHMASVRSWLGAFNEFDGWLKYLKRESQQTDKWKELLDFSRDYIIDNNNDQLNARFSYDEIINIQSNTVVAKEKIKTLPLQQSQIDEINSKLDYLVEKAKDHTKIDWKNLFVGTLIQTIFQLSITPDLMHKVWHYIIGSYTVIKLILAK
jgi:hypothetical protein